MIKAGAVSGVCISVYRWIFARPQLKKVNLALFYMSLRGLGILNFENNKVSGERFLVKKLLPALIKNEEPIFFDVGANVGSYSAWLLSAFPSATIHAFEPHPKNFLSLKASCSPGTINSHNTAVGDVQGELTLYDRADFDGSSHASLYEDVIYEIHKQNTAEFTVPVETLDGFCERQAITSIDLLKIDTEGNELSVLRGARTLLKNKSIRCIHFEFNEMNIVSRAFFRDFRIILKDYDLYRLLPSGVIRLGDSPVQTELFAYQNIIAIPKDTEKF